VAEGITFIIITVFLLNLNNFNQFYSNIIMIAVCKQNICQKTIFCNKLVKSS